MIFALLPILWTCAVETPHAGPWLEFDGPVYDAGVVDQSFGQFLRHDFVLRNSGDQPVRIEQVRTSCKCAVVAFDSVVAPGDSSSMRVELDLRDMGAGRFERTIDMATSARNAGMTRLVFTGILRPAVASDAPFVPLVGGDTQGTAIVLRSRTPGLQVTAAHLRLASSVAMRPALGIPPLPLSVRRNSSDSLTADGWHVSRFAVAADQAGVGLGGALRLETNNPLVPVLEMRCVIAAWR